jgi:hypothetical protein
MEQSARALLRDSAKDKLAQPSPLPGRRGLRRNELQVLYDLAQSILRQWKVRIPTFNMPVPPQPLMQRQHSLSHGRAQRPNL